MDEEALARKNQMKSKHGYRLWKTSSPKLSTSLCGKKWGLLEEKSKIEIVTNYESCVKKQPKHGSCGLKKHDTEANGPFLCSVTMKKNKSLKNQSTQGAQF